MQAADDRIPADPIEDQAIAALTMATHRLQTPFRDRVKRLVAVLRDIDALAATGHNEAECRMYETVIAARCDVLFGGKSATCERTALRMELEADTQEDHAQGTLAIEGKTPATVRHHAHALLKQSVTSRTLAALRLREAEEIDRNRITAQQRVGVR